MVMCGGLLGVFYLNLLKKLAGLGPIYAIHPQPSRQKYQSLLMFFHGVPSFSMCVWSGGMKYPLYSGEHLSAFISRSNNF